MQRRSIFAESASNTATSTTLITAMQNSKGFSAALDAKPFVPRRAVQGEMALQPTAQPFVPSSTPTTPPSQLRGMSSAAQPFIPQTGVQGTAGVRRAQAKAGHPLLPDSDDFLGMTASTPEDFQHQHGHLQSALVPADRSAPSTVAAGPSASVFRPHASPFDATGPGSAPRPSPAERGPAGSMQPPPPPPAFLPSAPRAPLAAAFARARTPDGGRGRGRGKQPPFPGPAAVPLPLQPAQHPQQAAQPLQMAGSVGKAAMLASAQADRLRQGLAQRSYHLQAQMDSQAEPVQGFADLLHSYHSLYPLEDISARAERPSPVFGVPSAVLKGIGLQNGQAHAIRRFDARQVPAAPDLLAAAQEAVNAWAPLGAHPHLAVLRATFASSTATGQPAVCVAHSYWPGAVTLEQAHLQPSATGTGLVRSNNASEEVLWSYLVQLTLALRAVHSAGLACRGGALHQSKVLLTSPGRIRIGSVGVLSILEGRPGGADAGQQVEDLVGLARLILALGCSGGPLSLEVMAARFSPELVRIVHAALPAQDGGAGAISSWHQLSGLLGDRLLGELDARAMGADATERALAREAENGRLLRLLVRLSLVHGRQRPDAPSWAEDGDRYLLKLFHDWLFSAQGQNGRPLLDWGRVVEALNKLDAGLPERIALLSRDEATLLAVSYADLKRCLQSSYAELQAAAASAAAPPHLSQVR